MDMHYTVVLCHRHPAFLLLASPMYIHAYTSWGYGRMWHRTEPGKLTPLQGKYIYTRLVVLLVDNGTFSAAEDFYSVFLCIKKGQKLQ